MSATADAIGLEAPPGPPPAPRPGLSRRLWKNPTIAIGASILALILLMGLAAPLLTRLDLSSNSTTSDPSLAASLSYLLLPQIFFYGMAALCGTDRGRRARLRRVCTAESCDGEWARHRPSSALTP